MNASNVSDESSTSFGRRVIFSSILLIACVVVSSVLPALVWSTDSAFVLEGAISELFLWSSGVVVS